MNPFLPSDLSAETDHAVCQSIDHYRELAKRLARIVNPGIGDYQNNVTEALSVLEAELERRQKNKRNPAGDWFQIWR